MTSLITQRSILEMVTSDLDVPLERGESDAEGMGLALGLRPPGQPAHPPGECRGESRGECIGECRGESLSGVRTWGD